jgi:NitT/TauT family transport system ATP-binding protein
VASERFAPFSSKSAITCRNLGKVWGEGTPRAHEALRGIDLDVEAREFVVLLGPSGCGKSTLLYLIAGLEGATSGQSWFFGDPIAGPSPERSLIFQETSLFPWLSVWQNVSFGLSIRGVGITERREIARQALQRVGLTEAIDKRPDELSGGMRQRVAIARAFVVQPNILLADEAFGHLDEVTAAELRETFLALARECGSTAVLITHQLEEAIGVGNRIIVLGKSAKLLADIHVARWGKSDYAILREAIQATLQRNEQDSRLIRS